jgi:hypothetical protein
MYISPVPPKLAVIGGLLRKAFTSAACPTPIGLGATLSSRNAGIVCARTGGKATVVTAIVSMRNIAIAVANLFLVILFSP